MGRKKQYATGAERSEAYRERAAVSRVIYDVRGDATYNKAVLQELAKRLTGGSVTGLINAALQAYIPTQLDPQELEGIIQSGHKAKEPTP